MPALQLPEGARPWPDVEALTADLIDHFVQDVAPTPSVVTVIPLDYEKTIESAPMVVVKRVGGGVITTGQVDRAMLSIGVLASTRRDSWVLLNFIRSQFTDYSSGADIGGLRLVDIEENVGPVQKPWENPDQRLVNTVVTVEIRRPRRSL